MWPSVVRTHSPNAPAESNANHKRDGNRKTSPLPNNESHPNKSTLNESSNASAIKQGFGELKRHGNNADGHTGPSLRGSAVPGMLWGGVCYDVLGMELTAPICQIVHVGINAVGMVLCGHPWSVCILRTPPLESNANHERDGA